MRASRRRLLTRLLVDPYYQPKEVNRQRFRLLNWVLGGYRPCNLPVDVDAIKEVVSPKPPEGEEKLAIILEGNISEFAALDRYERRALTRRKAAIRNFDAARTLAVTQRPYEAFNLNLQVSWYIMWNNEHNWRDTKITLSFGAF